MHDSKGGGTCRQLRVYGLGFRGGLGLGTCRQLRVYGLGFRGGLGLGTCRQLRRSAVFAFTAKVTVETSLPELFGCGGLFSHRAVHRR
jgi:hypothetical protein